MLETAARAVAKAQGFEYTGENMLTDPNPRAITCVILAMAVVTAIEIPSFDMREAAYESVRQDDMWRIEDDDDWLRSWHAALDAM